MCGICKGASEDEVRRHLGSLIDERGWAIQAVEPSEEEISWAYTIGLAEHFGHSELVITSIELDDAAGILHQLAVAVRGGRRFAPGGRADVGGVPVEFVAVHPAQFELGLFASWLDHYRAFGSSGPKLSALQVILPPWLFCDWHRGHIPRLDEPEPALGIPAPNRAFSRALRRRGHSRGRGSPGPTR
jgi:hypothetical protein